MKNLRQWMKWWQNTLNLYEQLWRDLMNAMLSTFQDNIHYQSLLSRKLKVVQEMYNENPVKLVASISLGSCWMDHIETHLQHMMVAQLCYPSIKVIYASFEIGFDWGILHERSFVILYGRIKLLISFTFVYNSIYSIHK